MSDAYEAESKLGVVAWRRRKEQRNPEILSAARQILEEEGYAQASMAKIARRAGVSEATLYKYFSNKQDLMNRVLDSWASTYIEGLKSEIVHVEGIRPRLRLIAIRYLRGMQQTPKLHRVYYQELRWDKYFGTPLHKLNREFAQVVVDAVKSGVQDGQVRASVDPVIVRDLLFGGLEHIGIRTTFAGRPLDVEREAINLTDQILDGVVQHPAVTVAGSDKPIDRLEELIERLRDTIDVFSISVHGSRREPKADQS